MSKKWNQRNKRDYKTGQIRRERKKRIKKKTGKYLRYYSRWMNVEYRKKRKYIKEI